MNKKTIGVIIIIIGILLLLGVLYIFVGERWFARITEPSQEIVLEEAKKDIQEPIVSEKGIKKITIEEGAEIQPELTEEEMAKEELMQIASSFACFKSSLSTLYVPTTRLYSSASGNRSF